MADIIVEQSPQAITVERENDTLYVVLPTTTNDKVKVSSDDTTSGYLADTLTEGTGISLTVGSPGGDETLAIANTDTGSGAVTTHESSYDHTLLHSPVTIADTATIDMALTGQQVSANLIDTAVTPGAYTNTNLTVDQQGRITAAASGTGGLGEQVKVSADDTTAGYLDGKLLPGTGIALTVGSPAGNETLTAGLADTAVTPGAYTTADITVDQQGRITAAASGAGGGMAIGDAITGATAGSVLFVDASAQLGQDNASLFFDDTNNRIGIGTTTPVRKLEIIDSTYNQLRLTQTNNVTYVDFSLSNAGKLNIAPSHLFVGINRPVPKAALDVNGNLLIGPSSYQSIGDFGDGVNVNLINFVTNNAGNFFFGSNLYYPTLSSTLTIAKTHATLSGAGIAITGNGQPRQNNIEFFTTPPASVVAGTAYLEASNPRLVIQTDGNIGINVTAPSARLHVAGNVLFQNSADTTTAFQVKDAAGTAILTADATNVQLIANGNLQIADAKNIVLNTTTGTKIGTATTQKLSFFDATPVVQPAAVADATGAGDIVAQFNTLLARIRTLGLIAT